MPAAPRFVAGSRAMRAVLAQVRRFARSDSNVLITGETGTGKNALAREIHAQGPRAGRAFVTVDCAGFSASLIDSELFGHERGAFTGAVAARAGRFELAGDGTVYLDAVTEMPIEIQGKLLRIVEEKRVERVGSSTSVTIAARIVASADARIEEAVTTGFFRQDLYHRLRVLPLAVPPLREHREDVLPLAQHFLKRAATGARRAAPAISRDAAAALGDYAWPGNVRELRHVVERAFDAADGGPITLSTLPAEVLDAGVLETGALEPFSQYGSVRHDVRLKPDTTAELDGGGARRPTLDEIERRYIASTLRITRGNQTDAARMLGISRKALWEKRKRYGLG
jgi:DNA-binding NtrC family response regulator